MFVRIDGDIPEALLEEFLQRFRALERCHPDDWHFSILMDAEGKGMEEVAGMLREINPELPYVARIKRDDMTDEQKKTLAKLYAMLR